MMVDLQRLQSGCLVCCSLLLHISSVVTAGRLGIQGESRQDDGHRFRRSVATCEEKYAGQTPTHTMCLPDYPAAKEAELTERDKKEIVDLHNKLRRCVEPSATNMQKVVWDDRLARTAQKLAMRCKVEHDENHSEPDYPGVPVGQNLGAGHSNFSHLIYNWYEEASTKNYVYGGPYIKGAGHYFQLMYHGVSRIGCGEAHCPGKWFGRLRVCNYILRLDAEFAPYESGPSGSQCPKHLDESGKLCDCQGKICFHQGTVDVSTCQCQCKPGWKGDNCEERDCPLEDTATSCRILYKEEDCGKTGFVADPEYCPVLCGLCPKPCENVQCHNGGTLDRETCRCNCAGVFEGEFCEICPEEDALDCILYYKDDCKSPFYQAYTTTNCPIFCDICPSR